MQRTLSVSSASVHSLDGDTSDTKSEMEELIRQKAVDAIVAKAKKAEEEKNDNSNNEEKKKED